MYGMCMHFTYSHVIHVLLWLRSVALMQELMSPMAFSPHFKQWQVTWQLIQCALWKACVNLYDASLLEIVLRLCSQNGESAQH